MNSKLRLAGALTGLALAMCRSAGSSGPPAHPMICTRETREHCLTPGQIETLLVSKDARIVAAEPTPSGGNGAWVLTLEAPFQGRKIEFRAKWRPDTTRTGGNSPRRELAAYAMQRLFLDPLDYVHPPTRSRCFELEHYRSRVDPTAKPSFPQQSSCVFGSIAYWVEGASTFSREWYDDDPVLDDERWRKDAVFRRTLGDANLLTYATLNGDTHTGNWLTVDTSAGQRVYMIDSSISFTRHRNPALTLRSDFSAIVVPLTKRSADRVMRIDGAALASLSAIERIFADHGWLSSEWVDASVRHTLSGERPYEFVDCPPQLGCEQQFVLGLTAAERTLVMGELWHLQMRLLMGELPLLETEGPP